MLYKGYVETNVKKKQVTVFIHIESINCIG